jgi:hypothetical protein
MEKIIIPRGMGKTYQLIKRASKSGDYIVCHNQHEASRIQSIALSLGFKINFPITYHEFIEKQYEGKNISGFLIDNVELLLESLTNVPIHTITMSHNS